MLCTPPKGRMLSVLIVLLSLCPLFVSAQIFKTFRAGVKQFERGHTQQAERIFQKKLHQQKWAPGSLYYLARLRQRKAYRLDQWAYCDSLLCVANQQMATVQGRQQKRLERRKVTPRSVLGAQTSVQKTALNYVSETNSVLALDSLLALFHCWVSKEDTVRDRVRTEVVNNNVGTHDYDVATSILNNHPDWVREENHEAAWQLQDSVWFFFTRKYPLCRMDTFRNDHPDNLYALDCWFDPLRDAACSGALQQLLALHSSNLYTALEYDLINEALRLGNDPNETLRLNAAEKKHLSDLQLLYALRDQLSRCVVRFDSLALVRQMDYYARTYAPRRTAFELLEDGADYLLQQRRWQETRDWLRPLPPFFPDSNTCDATPNLLFQIGKQPWFKRYLAYLDVVEEDLRNAPVTAWNTPTNWEYNAVSYGDGNEALFARRNPKTKTVNVLRSVLSAGQWSKPEIVATLSRTGQLAPLSLTNDGRTLLLGAGSRLYLSTRPDTSRFAPWSTPTQISVRLAYVNHAVLAPDGSSLVLSGTTRKVNGRKRPVTDLFVSIRTPEGTYTPAEPLDSLNSWLGTEARPYLCADNRTLLYSSNVPAGFGELDVQRVQRPDTKTWEKWSKPVNFGWRVNGVHDDLGFSFVPDYGGDAFYTRIERCSKMGLKNDRDIWQMDLPGRARPEAPIKMSGLVLDHATKRAVSGGFVEFRVESTSFKSPKGGILSAGISKGSYNLRLPDSTSYVRAYPSAPGYFTELDARHNLAGVKGNTVVRDTFYLWSFAEISRNIQLEYAKFDDGQDVLNNTRVFAELATVARMADRFGAELHLIGHTDSSGTEAANKDLALRRATVIQQHLVNNLGFRPDQVRVSSQGATQPRCPNNTPEGRACNRRVEVEFVLPKR